MAARQARVLVQRFGANLTLLHVRERWRLSASSTDCAIENRLEEFRANELRGLVVNPVVAAGDPATAITEWASCNDCDLILMPTHGYGAAKRLFLGSVLK